VTAKTEHGALRTLRHTGLLPFMDAVIGADSCARCKPHPEPVLLALERLGAAPEGAVLVGDARHDIEAARAAGVAAIGAGWGVSPAEDLLAAGAGRVLADVRELAGVLARLEPTAT
jgi:pyrophosphatase PpaX